MKKILYGFLAFVMSVSVACGCYFVASSKLFSPKDFSESVEEDQTTNNQVSGNWIDYSANSYAGGDGSKANPYQIANGSQLARLAYTTSRSADDYDNEDWYKSYKLIADIDLADHGWTPIGSYISFMGEFNGNGYVIKNMTLVGVDSTYISTGFFGSLYSGANIHDLIFQNAQFETSSSQRGQNDTNLSILAGKAYGATISKIGIVSGYIRINYNSLNSNEINVGGLVGKMDHTNLEKSFCIMILSTNENVANSSYYNNKHLGGLVGHLKDNSNITDCYYDGGINIYGFGKVGGLVGFAAGTNKNGNRICITNSYFYDYDTSYLGCRYGGGLVGHLRNDVYIRSCFVDARIEAHNNNSTNDRQFGALAGYKDKYGWIWVCCWNKVRTSKGWGCCWRNWIGYYDEANNIKNCVGIEDEGSGLNFDYWTKNILSSYFYTSSSFLKNFSGADKWDHFNEGGGYWQEWNIFRQYDSVVRKGYTWNRDSHKSLSKGLPVLSWALKRIEATSQLDIVPILSLTGSHKSSSLPCLAYAGMSVKLDANPYDYKIYDFAYWYNNSTREQISTNTVTTIYVSGGGELSETFTACWNGAISSAKFVFDDNTVIENIQQVATIKLIDENNKEYDINDSSFEKICFTKENAKIVVSPKLGYALAKIKGINKYGNDVYEAILNNLDDKMNVKNYGDVEIVFTADSYFNPRYVGLSFVFTRPEYTFKFQNTSSQLIASRTMQENDGTKDAQNVRGIYLYKIGSGKGDDRNAISHDYGFTWKVYYGFRNQTVKGNLIYSFEDLANDAIFNPSNWDDQSSFLEKETAYSRLTFDILRNMNVENKKEISLTMEKVQNQYEISFNDKANLVENTEKYFSTEDCKTTVKPEFGQNNVAIIGSVQKPIYFNKTTVLQSIKVQSANGYYLKAICLKDVGADVSNLNKNLLYNGIVGNDDPTYEQLLENFYANVLKSEQLNFGQGEIDANRKIDVFNFFSIAKFEIEGETNIASANNLLEISFEDGNGQTQTESMLQVNEVYCNSNITLKLNTSVGVGARFMGWFLRKDGEDLLLSENANFTFNFSPENLTFGREFGFGYENQMKLQKRIIAKYFFVEGQTQVDCVRGIYNISTVSDLLWLANEVDKGNSFDGILLRQTANIDMVGVNFMPIGTEQNPFKGVYDGNNFVISNLTINLASQTNVGLFGFVDGATIKNLTVVSGNVSGFANVGAIAGYANNTKFENINNKGCKVSAGKIVRFDIYGKQIETENEFDANQMNFAGVVGVAQVCQFFGCSNRTDVVGTNNFAGLVASVLGGKIECSFTTNLKIVGNISDTTCVLTDWFDAEQKVVDNAENWKILDGVEVLKQFYW